VVALFFWWSRRPPAKHKHKHKQQKQGNTAAPKKTKKVALKKQREQLTTDPLLYQQLKVHSDHVGSVCWHPNGEYLITTSKDRALRIFPTATLAQSASFQYINLGFDYAERCAVSADGALLVLLLGEAQTLRIYTITRGKQGQLALAQKLEFASQHKAEIRSMEIAPNGKFILTCSHEDAIVKLWSLQGRLLEQFDTKKLRNNMAAISPNSKFFTVGCFTGDLRIWEVLTQKGTPTWEFEKTTKAMDLAGHTSSVYALAFSPDSRRLATASKDGTWKMWDINVRYTVGEDPKCLFSIPTKHPLELLVFAPDSTLLAATSKGNLYFYETTRGKLVHTVESAHAGRHILSIVWAPNSSLLATIAMQDKAVHIWQKPTEETS